MPRAIVNGVDTHYEVVGDGPAVLGIHGGYGGAGTSVGPFPDLIAAALEGEARYLSYDRRGHGRSEYVAVRYTNDDLVGDAIALLDHVGIERCLVVGSSAGGPIALQLALDFPRPGFGPGADEHRRSAHGAVRPRS